MTDDSQHDKQQGAEEERERIVAWMRRCGRDRTGYLIEGPRSSGRSIPCDHDKHGWEDCADCEVQNIADAIERGDAIVKESTDD